VVEADIEERQDAGEGTDLVAMQLQVSLQWMLEDGLHLLRVRSITAGSQVPA
jgi:hypothetical protein